MLCRQSVIELYLLHISLVDFLGSSNANESWNSSDATVRIISSFKDRFVGFGKMKDYTLKPHIGESVQPIAQPVKIPFEMRAKIENKIDELEKL